MLLQSCNAPESSLEHQRRMSAPCPTRQPSAGSRARVSAEGSAPEPAAPTCCSLANACDRRAAASVVPTIGANAVRRRGTGVKWVHPRREWHTHCEDTPRPEGGILERSNMQATGPGRSGGGPPQGQRRRRPAGNLTATAPTLWKTLVASSGVLGQYSNTNSRMRQGIGATGFVGGGERGQPCQTRPRTSTAPPRAFPGRRGGRWMGFRRRASSPQTCRRPAPECAASACGPGEAAPPAHPAATPSCRIFCAAVRSRWNRLPQRGAVFSHSFVVRYTGRKCERAKRALSKCQALWF